MYVYKDEAEKLLVMLRGALIGELKDKHAFLASFLSQDDWSFVIKAHALIEAAVTQMLVERLGEARLAEFVRRLPLSDSQMGKIVIAKQLNLLNEKHLKFIKLFSELRNSLVHRLNRLGFRFTQHVLALDRNQRRSWRETILWFVQDDASRRAWGGVAEKNPRVVVYMALLFLIVECVVVAHQSKGRRKIDALAKKTARAMLKGPRKH